MRAVVLAAGRGSRLGTGPGRLPKPLVLLQDRPLIAYALEAVAAAGIHEALVVTGHRATEVRRTVQSLYLPGLAITFVNNPAFESPASTSLRAARAWCGEASFLLLMSDHVPSAAFVQGFLAAAPAGACSVAADFSPRPPAYTEEATRLALDSQGCVTAIGKGLAAWDALDAGAFILQPSVWDTVASAPERCELSVIFSSLASRSGLRAVDVSGSFWYDIDTPEDLAAAGDLLAESPSASAPSRAI
jgi:choline kinase